MKNFDEIIRRTSDLARSMVLATIYFLESLDIRNKMARDMKDYYRRLDAACWAVTEAIEEVRFSANRDPERSWKQLNDADKVLRELLQEQS